MEVELNLHLHPQGRRLFLFRAMIALAGTAALNFQPRLGRADDNPWTAADAIDPNTLAEELAHADASTRPTILYVGFKPLFAGGHITGALYHGTSSSATGLAEMKKWAATLPRTKYLVIYCGCCPFGYCPNIRPAFAALHAMGFARLRVLVMPNNFASDWVEKGYPVEKGP